MVQNKQEFDVEEAKRDAKQQYKEKTGQDLPDHVLDNYEILSAAGPSFKQLEEMASLNREHTDDRLTKLQAVSLVIASAVLFGGVGYGAGLGLAANFGIAVVGVVSALFGFSVAALLS